jgi:di/tricarboxylate transporter
MRYREIAAHTTASYAECGYRLGSPAGLAAQAGARREWRYCTMWEVKAVTPQVAITLLVMTVAITLLISDRVRMDAAALLVLLALVFTGLLTPQEAFAGFASPAIVAVASLFVVSAGLFQTGLARRVGRKIIGLAGSSEARLVVILMIGVSLLSAVMNNVGAVAVLLPVVVGIAKDTDIAPSRLLIPLAYGGVLGGTLTLIGTPPNLIVSDMLVERGLPPLGFFEITRVGVPLLVAGIAFMATLGRRLLPTRLARGRVRPAAPPEELIGIYHLPEHLFAVMVPAESPIVGQSLSECQMQNGFDLTALGLLRDSECVMVPDPKERLRAGDRVLVEGGPQRVKRATDAWGLVAEKATTDEAELLLAADTGLVEVTLAPRSHFEGQSLREIHFREKYGVTALALWRGREPIERNLGDIPLRMGDVLLVQGSWRRVRLLRRDPELIVLVDENGVPRRTRKAPWAIAILVGMIAVVIANLVPISVAALGAAVLMVFTGCLTIEEAQRAIEWRVIFVIVGMLALGLAMQRSGTTEWVASTLLSPVAKLGALPVLAALFAITAGLALVMSNYASAALLAPVALSVATAESLDARPLALLVAVASSVAFATPLAHQSNLLVMGPGEYKFGDYAKAGLPLSLIAMAVVVLGAWVLW